MELIKLDLDELVQQYESGCSLRQLAKQYGTSKATIKRKLAKAGVDVLTSAEFIETHRREFQAISNPMRKTTATTSSESFDFVEASRALWERARADGDLIEELYGRFIKRALDVHGDKYSYSRRGYSGPDKKAEIGCPIHGSFWQLPSAHIKGHGCPICGRLEASRKQAVGLGAFVERAAWVHGDKYDYSRVRYANYKTLVTIICPEHGAFGQTPAIHLRGGGCPACAAHDAERFAADATKIHGDRYDYNKVAYVNSKTKVAIGCPIHGEFDQRPNAHLSGHGCLYCARENTTSEAENELYAYIDSFGFEAVRHSRSVIPPLELDVFVPSRRLAVEYNGVYWHSYGQGDEEDRFYHARKYERCAEQGVQLVQIFEDEWSNLTKRAIVKSRLAHLLGATECGIYARNCELCMPSQQELAEFMQVNHLQGARGAKFRFALMNGGRAVAMASFNGHKDGFELIRYACCCGIYVVGGFSRMLHHFIKQHPISRIVSYADRRYSNGDLYRKCGFHLDRVCSPNYRYVLNGATYSRQQFQKHKLAQKLAAYDPTLTEAQNMFRNGYRRLWDAGHFRFVKDNKT